MDEHRRLFNAAILKYLKKVADETESVIDESEIVHQPKKHKSATERKSKVKWYIDSSCFVTSYLSILRQITIFNEDEYEEMKKYLNDGDMAVPNILKKKVWSFRKIFATIQYSSHESYIVNKKDIEKATLPGRGDNLVDFAKLRRCITSTELFDRLREVHMDQGHGAARKTHEAANQRYSNVTRTMCELYVQFCSCQLDSKLPGRPEQVKPIMEEVSPGGDVKDRRVARAQVTAAQMAQAKRMKRAMGGRTNALGTLAIGTVVRVPVDKVDRSKVDHRSIPGLICEATEHDQYRIVCAAGVLKSTLYRGAFFVDAWKTPAVYGLQDALTNWQQKKRVSVREALAHISMVGGQGHVHCGCKTKCDNNRCSCKKEGLLCNSRCHPSSTCCANL